MDFTFFNQLLIILSLSVICIALFYRVRLPDTLSYLAVGIILGPSITGVIESDFDISLLAEIGVVFLLFTLGLEFSIAKMVALRQVVFGLGGLQVLVATLFISGIAIALGLPPTAAVVVGAGLSLSSTAIVSRELSQRNEIIQPHGQLAIGVLLFQDIAAVLFLILIPALAGTDSHILLPIGMALLKGTLLVVVMMLIGKWVLPAVFHEIAQVRSQELFVLSAIVTALLAAWVTHVLDLSMALGGFVAGMMLGESHYRHQIEADIRPFRDILLGLFFVSVGLMIDVNDFAGNIHWVLLASAGLILFKLGLIFTLGKLMGHKRSNTFRAALALAQAGEFSLALMALASQYDLVSDEISSIVLAVTIISMTMTPLLIRFSPQLTRKVFGNKEQVFTSQEMMEQACGHVEGHTLICGFGRVGQAVSRILSQEQLGWIAIDDDPLHVREATRAGEPVFYGDCRRADMLLGLGLKRARLVVLCINSSKEVKNVLAMIREHSIDVPVLVRTRDDSHLDELMEMGATNVIPEVLESSLQIAGHVLMHLGQDPAVVRNKIQHVRAERYQTVNACYLGQTEPLFDQSGQPRSLLHGIPVSRKAWCHGKKLSEIDLDYTGVTLDTVKRLSRTMSDPLDQVLQENDIILVRGDGEQVEHAESLLLTGK
ncbi:cation:proton antiporter domain-containing protein [Endozoicomonadaceae bacterium StTr2]